jgi:hypothetical protein
LTKTKHSSGTEADGPFSPAKKFDGLRSTQMKMKPPDIDFRRTSMGFGSGIGMMGSTMTKLSTKYQVKQSSIEADIIEARVALLKRE